MFFSFSRLAEWCGNELPGYLWCSDGFRRLVAVDTSADAQNQTNPVPFLLISPKEKAPLDQSLKVLLRSNSASVCAGGSLVSGLRGLTRTPPSPLMLLFRNVGSAC